MYVVYKHTEIRKARVIAKINAYLPEGSPKEDVVIELPNKQVKIVERLNVIHFVEDWPNEQEHIEEGSQAGAQPQLDQ